MTGYASADRMEESNAWRHPVDLVRILEVAFEQLPDALDKGRAVRAEGEAWSGAEEVLPLLHGDDPQAIADGLLSALGVGASEVDLAVTVSHAAALRIVRFHTSNEFSDWDTALHTFTFANAVEGGLRRAPSPELVRGVFDAAMSVYLDRFLNIPAARLPEPVDDGRGEDELLDALDALLDRQQQVSQAGPSICTAAADQNGCWPGWGVFCCAKIATFTRSRLWRGLSASTDAGRARLAFAARPVCKERRRTCWWPRPGI